MVKTWALVKDGVVINTVLASDEDIKDPQFTWIDVTGTTIGINWVTQDNKTFDSPTPDAYGNSISVTLNG